ncbi:hypothetical protein BJ741DRAFT_695779 [Chytriomyces cf. hyalinus JEL632]|nr:hypothetical protein BJ741DRAFT_695779 [Chytriomyces cf. hyalinus JEL632]
MVHQVLQSLSDSDSMFTARLADASPNTMQLFPYFMLPNVALVHNVTKYKLDGNDDGFKLICEVLRRNAGKNGAILLDTETMWKKQVSKLPKELLYDNQLLFVGNYNNADLTRLAKHSELDSEKVCHEDLAKLAMSQGIQLQEKGLAFLCQLFLQKHLGKAPAIEDLTVGSKVLLFPPYADDLLAEVVDLLAVMESNELNGSLQDMLNENESGFDSGIAESSTNVAVESSDATVHDNRSCCAHDSAKLAAVEGEQVYMRLNIFHAMQQISQSMLNSHGAYRAFMARLQDAFLIVCREDIEIICDYLKSTGKTDHDIKEMKENDWYFFIKNSQRVCPPKQLLLLCFDCMVAAFSDVKDSKTDQQPMKAHIKNSCISDVPDISLYDVTDRTKEGFAKYRCCCGTNSNEGFHCHLHMVLHMYSGSLYLLHLVLLVIVYHWNLQMAIKNQELDQDIGGFYNQHVLEEINMITEPQVNIAPYTQ